MNEERNEDDIADKLDGDLGAASEKCNKVMAGTIRRKTNVVCQYLLKGQTHRKLFKRIMDGADGPQVRFKVWRRARKNARLALLLPDWWKREAEAMKDNVRMSDERPSARPNSD